MPNWKQSIDRTKMLEFYARGFPVKPKNAYKRLTVPGRGAQNCFMLHLVRAVCAELYTRFLVWNDLWRLGQILGDGFSMRAKG